MTEVYRDSDRYRTRLNTYCIHDTPENLLVVTAHDTTTYTFGGTQGDDDFYVDPDGGPFVCKGFNFIGTDGKKYTITRVIDFTTKTSEGSPFGVGSANFTKTSSQDSSRRRHDLVINCNYISENQ